MTLHHGDCLDVMAGMDPESADAIVTDPPYGLEFMGKEWDKLGRGSAAKDKHGQAYGASFYRPGWGQTDTRRSTMESQSFHFGWAEAAYRVAKPSAYLLAFGGTRTVHRMTVALEDAGWVIRDMLVWAYASGFPKSKASLKPAWEPIVMARKPGPLRMLAIDECRIGVTDGPSEAGQTEAAHPRRRLSLDVATAQGSTEDDRSGHWGRWPSNVILTDPIFDGGVAGVVGGGYQSSQQTRTNPDGPGADSYIFGERPRGNDYLGDSGTYSRFFLIPKADRSDREPVIRPPRHRHPFEGGGYEDPSICAIEGCADLPETHARANQHPTVKPTDLMRHLVRLVTPPGGVVLDPFLGSGSTAIAAEMEGFAWVGIEREAEYVAIAEARLNGTQKGLGLVG